MAAEVTARAKWIRMSAYKAREAAQLIRGKSIDEARRILAFTPKASARAVSKVLESAVANAEHNFQIPQEELFVKIASADEGVTIKRFRPRAQGRGYRIRKRTCHINLTLERVPEAPVAPPRPRRSTSAQGKPSDGRTQTKPSGRTGQPSAAEGGPERPKRTQKASTKTVRQTRGAAGNSDEGKEGT